MTLIIQIYSNILQIAMIKLAHILCNISITCGLETYYDVLR